jgi:UDP-glucose 4-epimerase
VLEMVAKVNGAPLNIQELPRRAGDPPSLVADASRIRETLGWQQRHDDLEQIVTTALNWERKLMQNDFRDQ